MPRIIGPLGRSEKPLDALDLGLTPAAARRPISTGQAQFWENIMARVFITGSSAGLGLMAGQLLADQGHQVVLHARNDARAADAKEPLPKAEAVVVGDLATIAATKDLAAQVNALGRFDAVIHNAAVGYREGHRETERRLAACLRHQHARALHPHRPDRAAEAARLSELGHARRARTPISTTFCGASGAGTDRRPTPRASCTMSCWLSPSRASGRMCCRTR